MHHISTRQIQNRVELTRQHDNWISRPYPTLAANGRIRMYTMPTYFPRLSTGANSLIPAVPITSAKPAPTPVIAIPPIATFMRCAVPTILYHKTVYMGVWDLTSFLSRQDLLQRAQRTFVP